MENYPSEKLCKVISVLNQASLYEDVWEKGKGRIASLILNLGTGLREWAPLHHYCSVPRERALCTNAARVTVFLAKV
jgi:hypothetical protein